MKRKVMMECLEVTKHETHENNTPARMSDVVQWICPGIEEGPEKGTREGDIIQTIRNSLEDGGSSEYASYNEQALTIFKAVMGVLEPEEEDADYTKTWGNWKCTHCGRKFRFNMKAHTDKNGVQPSCISCGERSWEEF